MTECRCHRCGQQVPMGYTLIESDFDELERRTLLSFHGGPLGIPLGMLFGQSPTGRLSSYPFKLQIPAEPFMRYLDKDGWWEQRNEKRTTSSSPSMRKREAARKRRKRARRSR